MLAAMKLEIEQKAQYWKDEQFHTVYFGGGTPSLLEPDEISFFLELVKDKFSVDLKEVTLEVNPDDFQDLERAKAYRSIGVNRLSMGIQSFDERELRWMNRAHTANEATLAIGVAAKAGYKDLSIDLIYGIPDSTEESWKHNLKIFLDFGIPHLSAYALTVEDKTPLDRMIKKGRMKPPDDNDFHHQFYVLRDLLLEASYEHYEISNFSLPGRRSLHNSAYWNRRPYLGIGPSAHSFKEPIRSWNVRSNMRYIEAIEQGKAYSEEEHLSTKDCWNEMVLTGLRTSDGVNLRLMPQNELSTAKIKLQPEIERFEKKGWLMFDGEQIKLSAQGLAYADFIASELFI